MSQQTQPLKQPQKKRLTLLGSTGSIGQNTLKILAAHPDKYELMAITGGNNVDLLIEQAHAFKPKRIVISNDDHYAKLKSALSGSNIDIASGEDALIETAAAPTDIVMSAIVGAAGLKPTLAAIRQGTTIALANKECLVCAGDVMNAEITQHESILIPVDSEHNAIFQLFDDMSAQHVEKITITASGGPFRTWNTEQMAKATVEEAVRHPNWSMGAKISVDSATLMNKGLELIEAYYLFPVTPDQLDVLIHPQSIVHCLVHMIDGSVLAQMSNPDMCTPIANALAWPERITAPVNKLDLGSVGNLQFEAPDHARFGALNLAYDAMRAGGSAPCTLNAANEIAVHRFLKGEITFTDIVKTVERTLESINNTAITTIDDVLACDQQARHIAQEVIL